MLTCSRAVHLELCVDLSTDKLILALQRFTGRPSLPNKIYTDNTQTFHAANIELRELCTVFSAAKSHQYLAEHGILGKFVMPRAA